jgi:hypothetical protein
MFSAAAFSIFVRSTVANVLTAKSALRYATQVVALVTGIPYEHLVHTSMWCQRWLILLQR